MYACGLVHIYIYVQVQCMHGGGLVHVCRWFSACMLVFWCMPLTLARSAVITWLWLDPVIAWLMLAGAFIRSYHFHSLYYKQ